MHEAKYIRCKTEDQNEIQGRGERTSVFPRPVELRIPKLLGKDGALAEFGTKWEPSNRPKGRPGVEASVILPNGDEEISGR